MRIVCKAFTDGTRQIYETSHDGKDIVQVFDGDDPRQRPIRVRRISAFIEVGCDNSEEGLRQVKEALARLPEILQSSN